MLEKLKDRAYPKSLLCSFVKQLPEAVLVSFICVEPLYTSSYMLYIHPKDPLSRAYSEN